MGAGNKTRVTSGSLAKKYGVSANSIKNWSDQWEKDGTLPKVPRTPGGHRIYGPEHAEVFEKKLSGQQPPPAPVTSASSGG